MKPRTISKRPVSGWVAVSCRHVIKIPTAPVSYVALIVTNNLFTVLDEWRLEGNEIHIKQEHLISKCSKRMSEKKSADYQSIVGH